MTDHEVGWYRHEKDKHCEHGRVRGRLGGVTCNDDDANRDQR